MLCNLGKLQLAIISNVHNSCSQMLCCFAFVITPAKPQLKEKKKTHRWKCMAERGFQSKKATTNLQLRRNTMQVAFYIHTKYKCRGWRTKDKIYSRYIWVCTIWILRLLARRAQVSHRDLLCLEYFRHLKWHWIPIFKQTSWAQKIQIISTITNTTIVYRLTIFCLSHSGPVT